MAITVHLDELLKARGMTGKELCAKVGITEANLSILRSVKASGVRFHTINKICYYLDCGQAMDKTPGRAFAGGVLPGAGGGPSGSQGPLGGVLCCALPKWPERFL